MWTLIEINNMYARVDMAFSYAWDKEITEMWAELKNPRSFLTSYEFHEFR